MGPFQHQWASVGVTFPAQGGAFRCRRASEHHGHQSARSFPVQAGKRASWASARCGFPTQAGTGSIMSIIGAGPLQQRWGLSSIMGISRRDLSGTGGSFPVQPGKRASWASVRCGFPTQAGTGSIMSIIGAGPLQQRWGLSSIMGISGRDLSGTGGSFPVQAGKRASWASPFRSRRASEHHGHQRAVAFQPKQGQGAS